MLYNLTGATTNIDLSLGTHVWETALAAESVGPLANGETITFTIFVTVPLAANWYLTDTAVVTATAATSPDLYFAAATFTTQAFAPPIIGVMPEAVVSTQLVDEIVTKNVVISNGNGITGTFAFQFPPSARHPDNLDLATWLSINPISGTIDSDNSQLVHFVFDAQGLPPGVYSTQIDLYTNDPQMLTSTIPVTMTISLPHIYLPLLLNRDS